MVDIHGDLVDTRQRVEHGHVRLGALEFRFVENIGVAQTQVVVLVEEAFLLHAGHVQHVKVADHGGEVAHFGVCA